MARRMAHKRYTYADYKDWPGDVRGELIDGVFYDMAPAPSMWYQDLVWYLHHVLMSHLQGKPCRAAIAPLDVFLFVDHQGEPPDDEEIDTIVQPDVLVYCNPKQRSQRGLHGAPRLVIEVLSPSTAKKDLWDKRDLYERSGVEEYWIVDPENKSIYQLIRTEGRYVVAPSSAETTQSASLPGFEVDLVTLFAQMSDM